MGEKKTKNSIYTKVKNDRRGLCNKGDRKSYLD